MEDEEREDDDLKQKAYERESKGYFARGFEFGMGFTLGMVAVSLGLGLFFGVIVLWAVSIR